MRDTVIITEYKDEYMIDKKGNIKEDVKMSLINMCMSIGRFNININIEKKQKEKIRNEDHDFSHKERKDELLKELNRVEIGNNFMDYMR